MPQLYIVRRIMKWHLGGQEYEAFFAHPRLGIDSFGGDNWLNNGVWKQAEAMILHRDEAVKVLNKFPDAVMVPVSTPKV